MLQPKTRWNVRQADSGKVRQLSEQLEIDHLSATLLVNRGIGEPEEARDFLHIENQEFHDPFLIPDMQKAVDRIKLAIREQEKILVFGDYDADGVTSTALLTGTLKELGAKVEFYIPDRFTEGYGPNEGAFKQAASEGVDLIITVDTGIAAVHEAEIAAELGMDLIITDHHEIRPEIPHACAIIHPRFGEPSYPFPDLAGVGVSFKLSHALYGRAPEHMLDLAAIGTVADLVPLHGENRLIVKKGIRLLRSTQRPGLAALSQLAGTNLAEANEETVGFTIGPRINAAGRLASADPAVELLMTEDKVMAEQLAEEIDSLNKERQAIVSEITKEAMTIVEESFPLEENKVLVVGKEGWNQGVIGIVASRLAEKYYRPVFVLSYDQESGLAKGSARSIKGFDLFSNMLACSELFDHFGGHPMAAGMTLAISKVDELRKRLNAAAGEQLSEEDMIPLAELDAVVPIKDITVESIQEIEKLAPYGVGNAKPTFLISDVNAEDVRKIGASQTHLKVRLRQEGDSLDGVGFNLGPLADDISPDAKISVIGQLTVNEWNNVRKPQIFIRDAAINEWQLFDLRGNQQPERWLPKLPQMDRIFVVFNEESNGALNRLGLQDDCLPVYNKDMAGHVQLDGKNVVLFDLPPNLPILEELIKGKAPGRIYAHFFHDRGQFFETIPTREHFKWYYAFLLKRRTFDLKRYGRDLEKFRGWSRETVHFMTKVFLELDFVKIKDGTIILNEIKTKKDLTESPTYKQKKALVEIENKLLYSTYNELKNWFGERVGHSSRQEEEIEAWT